MTKTLAPSLGMEQISKCISIVDLSISIASADANRLQRANLIIDGVRTLR